MIDQALIKISISTNLQKFLYNQSIRLHQFFINGRQTLPCSCWYTWCCLCHLQHVQQTQSHNHLERINTKNQSINQTSNHDFMH